MANVKYDNFILENKLTDLVETAVTINNYCTIDTSLTEDVGMIKKVIVKSAVGDVEDLEMGDGNTSTIEVSTAVKDYTVGVTQGRFAYYDEEEMADSKVVDMGLKAVSEKMTNDLNSKIIAELETDVVGTLKTGYTTAPTFDNFVDAIALLNIENEDNLFCLINPSMKGTIRKALKDDIKYSENFVATGYIGSVVGVPIIISKAVSDDTIIIASKEAVTVFVKKSTGIEQDRVANTRQNLVYGRKTMLVALTDSSKVALIKKTV